MFNFLTKCAHLFLAVLAVVSATVAAPVWPQAAVEPDASTASASGSAAVVLVLKDAALHRHWILSADPAHPGGPGRLVAAGDENSASAAPRSTPRGFAQIPARPPVVAAGGRLLVESHGARADLVLGAVALHSGAPGDEVPVRLLLSGRVLRAIVLGPGKARLLTTSGPAQTLWSTPPRSSAFARPALLSEAH